MKMKRVLSFFMILCMVLTMLPANVLAVEWPEAATRAQLPQRGTDAAQLVDGYYEIYTADQLYWFAEQVNSGNNSINGKLMNDIVVNENVLKEDGTLNGDGSNFRVWTPIGTQENWYRGDFLGNGKKISGLYIDTDEDNVGLFGYILNAIISNVTVVDSYLKGGDHVGGIVGYNSNSIVQYCTNAATIDGTSAVGGVIGYSCDRFDSFIFNEDCFCGEDRCDYCNPHFFEVTGCKSVGQVNGSGISGVLQVPYGDYCEFYQCYYLEGTATGGIAGQDIAGKAEGKDVSFFPVALVPQWAISTPELVNGYYQIYTADQLYWFAAQVNSGNTSINGKLMADIVVNENVLKEDGTLNGDGSNFREWTPINGYFGTFDGAQHTISGLFVNTPNANRVGLFGSTQQNSRIKNLGIVDSYFVGNRDVGSIVGFSGVQRYWETDDFDWSCAYYNYSHIENCFSTAIVSGEEYVGGLVGLHSGQLSNSYFAGRVLKGTNVGAIIGEARVERSEILFPEDYDPGSVPKATNCFYLPTCVSGGNSHGTIMSTEQFASGEAAYLLQGSQAEQVWGQTIGSDPYPVLGGTEVKYDHDIYYNENVSEVPILVNGYYEINTADQLYWFAAQVNSGNTSIDGKLMGDIAINKNLLKADGTFNSGKWRNWIPIGNSSNQYTGTFDGNSKTISGLYFNDTSVDYVGLFGCANGTIRNVCVVDSYLNGGNLVGGIVGYNYKTVSSCSNAGTVKGTNGVGGVVGISEAGTVENCSNSGSISGSIYVGGVLGENYGNATNCSNIGVITGTTYVGGVIGGNSGTVGACYNTGAITGDGVVNIKDFQRLLRHVNKTNPLF